ncbi:MAG: pilus assembly protein [Actinomycetes bacterium]
MKSGLNERRTLAADQGAAMVEFVLLAVTLVVPLVYLLLAVFDVQRVAFGASAATREAARVFVRSPSTAVGEERAHAAAALTMADHGVTLGERDLVISCSATPCLTPGATVQVSYQTRVTLPWLPAIGGFEMVSVPVSATHLQVVDEYTEVRP